MIDLKELERSLKLVKDSNVVQRLERIEAKLDGVCERLAGCELVGSSNKRRIDELEEGRRQRPTQQVSHFVSFSTLTAIPY